MKSYRSKGKTIGLTAAGLGFLVLLGVLFACRGLILERWLIHRLNSGDEAERRAAAERLGAMGSWRAVPRLLQIAGGHYSPGIQSLKLQPPAWPRDAIEKIGTPGMPGYIEVLKNGSRDARFGALHFLENFGPSAQAAVPAIIELYAASTDKDIRYWAVIALLEIDPESDATLGTIAGALEDLYIGKAVKELIETRRDKSLTLLIKLLESNESDAGEFAAQALGKLGPAAVPAVPALVAKLRRGELLSPSYALGRIGEAAVPALVEVVEDREAGRGARLRAISTLNNIGPGAASAVPALIEALGDGDPGVAGLASYALAKIGRAGEPAAGRLAAALREHPDASVRRGAAHALGQIGREDADIVLALTRALADEDPDVRWLAALSLGELRPEAGGAVGALIGALGDPETSPAAAQALGKIGPAAAPAVEPLARLLGDDDEWARLRAAEALGRLGARAEAAIPRLEAALADEEPKVRARAEQALLMIRGPGPPRG